MADTFISQMTAKRTKQPTKVQTQVLLSTRRRCAICYGLHGALRVKKGQIAHLDQQNSNHDPDNLAFLCLIHHASYDAKARQWKGFTVPEVKAFRAELIALREAGALSQRGARRFRSARSTRTALLLELYDRRISLYRIMRDFISLIIRDATLEIDALLKYRRDVDEAMFLFDASVGGYAESLFSRGLALRRTHLVGTASTRVEIEREQAWDENKEHLDWFSDQYSELRRLLYPFLQLTPH